MASIPALGLTPPHMKMTMRISQKLSLSSRKSRGPGGRRGEANACMGLITGQVV